MSKLANRTLIFRNWFLETYLPRNSQTRSPLLQRWLCSANVLVRMDFIAESDRSDVRGAVASVLKANFDEVIGLFRAAERTGDGRITQDDLEHSGLLPGVSSAHLSTFFELLSLNDDGAVEYREFFKVVRSAGAGWSGGEGSSKSSGGGGAGGAGGAATGSIGRQVWSTPTVRQQYTGSARDEQERRWEEHDRERESAGRARASAAVASATAAVQERAAHARANQHQVRGRSTSPGRGGSSASASASSLSSFSLRRGERERERERDQTRGRGGAGGGGGGGSARTGGGGVERDRSGSASKDVLREVSKEDFRYDSWATAGGNGGGDNSAPGRLVPALRKNFPLIVSRDA